MTIDMTVPGAIGRAERFGAEHLRGALDTWLITADNPVTVVGQGGQLFMRSQFALTLARLDDLPDGGHPRRREATHCLALGVLAREFKAGWLDDGAMPSAAADRLLYAEFSAGGDHTARAVSRAVASGFAHGEMPLQGRHVGMAFYRGVRMVALALGQVTFVPDRVSHPAD